MHAFDYITILFSFVYAMAISHMLATVGDLIAAGRRVVFSWIHAGWMITALALVVAWWIGLWDLRSQTAWNMANVGVVFAVACGLYVQTRLVCPRVPSDGIIDLRAFHRQEGQRYMAATAAMTAASVGFNTMIGGQQGISTWLIQNLAVIPMALTAALSAAFPARVWMQRFVVVAQLLLWVWYFATLQNPLSG